jgi:hypothetical protein
VDLIPVDCAVNDDHGSTTDRVQLIHLPGLELAADWDRGAHFRELPGHIRVSRRKWPARHLASCVGNIYWERYGMEPWTAAAFLHYLRASKQFQPDGGFEELWKWWESGIAAHAHVKALLIDAAKGDRL